MEARALSPQASRKPIQSLREMGLIDEAGVIRLHLGCGAVHLEGYINFEYPPHQHGAITRPVADVFADILDLAFPQDSVDEIRLHHVLEHFSRAESLALVTGWWSWLKPHGLLRVEVPDFDRTALAVLSPLSSEKRRQVALRHIYGSQEATWANHKGGWSGRRLARLMRDFGFEVSELRRSAWQGTYNVEILALKQHMRWGQAEFEVIAESWLRRSMVSDTDSERRSFDIWKAEYCRQVQRSWANDEA